MKSLPTGWKRAFQIIFFCVAALFVLLHLKHNWQEISGYHWHFRYGYLIISFVMGLFVQLFVVWAWKWVLRALGPVIQYRQALRIMSISLLAKYLPGMGWNYLAQMQMCARQGIGKTAAGVSILLERSVCFMGGMFTFLISLAFWGQYSPSGRIMFMLIVIPLGLVAIYPPVFEKILNIALRLARRKATVIRIRYQVLLLLMVLYVLFGWGIGGIAFYLFAHSVYPVNIGIITTIGILALSVNVGFLAPFMPGGIVVREAMLVSLLQFYMPLDVSIMIAVGFRFLDSLRELIFAVVATRL